MMTKLAPSADVQREEFSEIDLVENYETTANKFYIEMYCSADYKLTTLTGIQKINLFNIS